MIKTWFERNLNKAKHHYDMAEVMLIGKETAIDRYVAFDRAEKYTQKHLNRYSRKTDKNSVDEKDLERQVLRCRRKKYLEEWRLKDYYEVSDVEFEAMLPDPTRIFKRAAWIGVPTAAVLFFALAGIGIYFGNDWWQTRKRYKLGNDVRIPEIRELLKKEKLKEARSNYGTLKEERYEIPPGRYRKFWNDVDKLGDSLDSLELLLNARDSVVKAENLVGNSDYVVALKLVDSTRVLLGGIKNLPEDRKSEFEDLSKRASDLNERCSKYKYDSDKVNLIKDRIPEIKAKVNSLNEQLNKGELFELEKAYDLVKTVNRYLTDLDGIDPTAVGGRNVLESIKDDLIKVRTLVEGREGLLTGYELIEHNRVKKNAGKINESLTSLANTQYVEEGLDEEIKRIRSLLNVAKSDLRQVDSNRVDTFELVSDISGLENRLNDSAAKLNAVNRLRDSLKSANEDERVSAAVELVNKYFGRDFRAKRWDRVSKVVGIIPEHKRDSVEDIVAVVDLESKLLRDDGRIFARENGFNSGDLAGYDILTSDYAEKKDDKTVRNAVEILLKEADLKEGKDVIRLLDELSGLRKEKGDKERLGKIGSNAEMEAKRMARLDALPEEIEATEISVKIALEKLRDAAKAYLETGDKIPDLRLMTNLANSYTKLGKREVAEEINVKIEELKKKYKIE